MVLASAAAFDRTGAWWLTPAIGRKPTRRRRPNTASCSSSVVSYAVLAHRAAIERAVQRVSERDGVDFTTEHGLEQRRVMDALGTSGRFAVAMVEQAQANVAAVVSKDAE